MTLQGHSLSVRPIPSPSTDCANRHNDPQLWNEAPTQKRRGWVRVTCKSCGRFIGYHDPSRIKQKKTKAEMADVESASPPNLFLFEVEQRNKKR